MIHNSRNLSDYNIFKNSENVNLEKALFISETEILIYLYNEVDISQIQLYAVSYNNEFTLDKVSNYEMIKRNGTVVLIGDFSLYKNYKIKINDDKVNVILNPALGGIIDTDFDITGETNFGLSISNTFLSFKFWSPPAIRAEIIFFDKNQNRIFQNKTFLAKRGEKGIWTAEISKNEIQFSDNEAIYYRYLIYAYNKITQALDPYSKSMAIFNSKKDEIGKSAVIDLKSDILHLEEENEVFLNSKFIKSELDTVFYEINVRDFTIEPNIIEKNIAGTYTGFTTKINYLQDLGITHVQLLPINKCYTLNEEDKSFTDKTSKKSNYNWGYDPLNYFTVEGRYSVKPNNPYGRILEFKSLINSLHKKGIGVILDVVFNHTYIVETFENIAPGCYYRLKNDGTISGHTGAGPSLETRYKSVRKFIVDVLKYFVAEYKIDGFRFDLMGFLDHETMRQIRYEVGAEYNTNNINDLILQGEAWNFTDIDDNSAYTKDNLPTEDLHIAIFNDSFRDSLAGNENYHGVVQGNLFENSRLASGIVGGCKYYNCSNSVFANNVFFDKYNVFARNSAECLNYFSIHDGLTIWDKINLSVKDESKLERLKLVKMAATILFTSQGKIILQAGDEIMRTKPLADFDIEENRALTSVNVDREEDTNRFQENSYQSVDYTNMMRWSRLTNEYSFFANDLLNYFKKVIKFRREYFDLWQNSPQNLNNNFIFLKNENILEEEKYQINTFYDKKLKELTINFSSGPANQRYYLTGEVQEKDANPLQNKYYVDFDNYGNGKITFNRTQIDAFNINLWTNTPELNFKLVKSAGQWDYINYAYSETGNNSISASRINSKFEAHINLAEKNYKLEQLEKFYNDINIAYLIQADKKYKVAVIVNTSKKELLFKNTNIDINLHWEILLNSSTNKPYTNKNIIIENGIIKINSQTVLVLKLDL